LRADRGGVLVDVKMGMMKWGRALLSAGYGGLAGLEPLRFERLWRKG